MGQLRLLPFLELMYAAHVRAASLSPVLLLQLVVAAEVQVSKPSDKVPSRFNKFAAIVMVQARLSEIPACLAKARVLLSIQSRKQSIFLRAWIMVSIYVSAKRAILVQRAHLVTSWFKLRSSLIPTSSVMVQIFKPICTYRYHKQCWVLTST